MFMGYIDPVTGQEFEGPPAPTPDPPNVTEETPWYARPREVILDILGDITYVGDDVSIATHDGRVIVDVTDPDKPAAVTPAQPIGLLETIGRVPGFVWLGVGALVLYSTMRR